MEYLFVIKGYGVYEEINIPTDCFDFQDKISGKGLEQRYHLINDGIIPLPTVKQIINDVLDLSIGVKAREEFNFTKYVANHYTESIFAQCRRMAIEKGINLLSEDLDWYYVRRR